MVDIFLQYVRRMKEIRLLSTPDLSAIENENDYSKILVQNFSKIGQLAAENRNIINKYALPLFEKPFLSETEVKLLKLFCDLLLDSETFDEVDLHLCELINDTLLKNELDNKSIENTYVIAIAKRVQRDYFEISAITRFLNSDTEKKRSQALSHYAELTPYLEKDVFSRLSSEAKSAVLQFFLMGALLFENNFVCREEEYWQKALSIIERGEKILADPFYRDSLSNYDWESFEFRIYYYASFFAYSLLPESIAKKVYVYAKKAIDFLEHCTKENILAAVNKEQEEDLLRLAAVMANYTDAKEVMNELYSTYQKRNKDDFSVTGVNTNMDTPSSLFYISKMMNVELDERDVDRYDEIENALLKYLYRLPKQSDVYLKCITLFTNFPQNFKEVAMSMKDFCVRAFGAIHPPTYVHINMVARFSQCMARHLLKLRPELFIGFPDCNTVEQVIASKERILRYTYNAALCHDIGKLFIIDIISMYGRNLLDSEFEIIKKHPEIGARIAAEHCSTKDYVDVIRAHHLWYDCSHGYPSDFDTFKSPYKTIIDIVLAADCLDAATDTIGRSYNKGKSFLEYEQEVIAGSGSHYAPFLPELFKVPQLREDIEYLLNEGRQKQYLETFRLLKSSKS